MANYLLTVVTILPVLFTMTSCQLHNDVCGPSMHCNSTVGLVCDFGRCSCMSKDTLTSEGFNLSWDATKGLCVGNPGSACVGTRETPVPEGMKRVECVAKHSCIQRPNFPRSLGICKEVPAIFLHGRACSPSADRASLQFCDASAGLFCGPDKICICSNARVNTSPTYNMVWSEELGKCTGEIGSGCIGTKETPVSEGQKGVDCVPEAVCSQEAGKTPGVGICERAEGSSAEKLRNNVIMIGVFVLSYFNLYLFV